MGWTLPWTSRGPTAAQILGHEEYLVAEARHELHLQEPEANDRQDAETHAEADGEPHLGLVEDVPGGAWEGRDRLQLPCWAEAPVLGLGFRETAGNWFLQPALGT